MQPTKETSASGFFSFIALAWLKPFPPSTLAVIYISFADSPENFSGKSPFN
jgi:hypothetical protein